MSNIYSTSPANVHIEIIPHDTNEVPKCRALFVGNGGGDVTIVDRKGTELTYIGVDGILPVMPTIVMATGTTATNIIGFV